MKGDLKYTCELCNFGTNLKTDFNRHLNTKKHIKITNSQPQVYKCQFCDKEFNSKPSKRRHELHRCKNNSAKLKEQLENKEEEIKSMKVERIDLFKKIDKLLDKVGDTNIQTINNTINVNSYGKEDYSHINDQLLNYLVTIPYGMIPKMIEETHFNDNKPENKIVIKIIALFLYKLVQLN